MAAGSLARHNMNQHGHVEEAQQSWKNLATGEEPLILTLNQQKMAYQGRYTTFMDVHVNKKSGESVRDKTFPDEPVIGISLMPFSNNKSLIREEFTCARNPQLWTILGVWTKPKLGGPARIMKKFHIPSYPPKFFQPSGTTHNIIS